MVVPFPLLDNNGNEGKKLRVNDNIKMARDQLVLQLPFH